MQLYHQGQYITSPKGLATTMNQYFLEKVQKLRETNPDTEYDPLAKMKESMKDRTCTFAFEPVTVKQVDTIVAD